MSTPKPYDRIAILDIGKTNAKVVILDAGSGAEIAAVKTPNRVRSDGPYPHYDIDALWAFFIEALAGFAKHPGFDAISITTHGASAVLLDAAGGLALPVLDYEHEYAATVREAYAALRPAFADTFSPALPAGLNLGAQIHFQKSTFAEAFAEVAVIVTYPQYWAFRLTGIAACELTSLGCHTDLWRPQAGVYSDLVDTLGIRERMAPVRSAFDSLGPVLPELAATIGLPAGVPVYCGIHDSNASLLPHLLGRDAPFSVVSTGTWVVSFAVGGDFEHLDPARDTLANVDAYGRPVPSSRFMGGREFEKLTAVNFSPSGHEIDATVDKVIATGLMVLPSVAGASGPFPQCDSRWIGEPTDAAERLAATSLYAALMTDTCLSLIGAKGPTLVEGPFALNSAYLQALASLTGRPVIALPGSTGTSQGAALLTGIVPNGDGPQSRFEPQDRIGLAAYRARWIAAIGTGGE